MLPCRAARGADQDAIVDVTGRVNARCASAGVTPATSATAISQVWQGMPQPSNAVADQELVVAAELAAMVNTFPLPTAQPGSGVAAPSPAANGGSGNIPPQLPLSRAGSRGGSASPAQQPAARRGPSVSRANDTTPLSSPALARDRPPVFSAGRVDADDGAGGGAVPVARDRDAGPGSPRLAHASGSESGGRYSSPAASPYLPSGSTSAGDVSSGGRGDRGAYGPPSQSQSRVGLGGDALLARVAASGSRGERQVPSSPLSPVSAATGSPAVLRSTSRPPVLAVADGVDEFDHDVPRSPAMGRRDDPRGPSPQRAQQDDLLPRPAKGQFVLTRCGVGMGGEVNAVGGGLILCASDSTLQAGRA